MRFTLAGFVDLCPIQLDDGKMVVGAPVRNPTGDGPLRRRLLSAAEVQERVAEGSGVEPLTQRGI